MDRPPLTGSPKQVAWAEEIRSNFARHTHTMAERCRTGQLPWVNVRVRARLEALLTAISTNWLTTTVSAKAWIDHKNLGTYSGVEQFFVARLKRDEEAQRLMAAPRSSEVSHG